MKERLKLENFIFSRAACLQVSITGIGGKLYCTHVDPYLQISVYLYNCLYAAWQATDFYRPHISGEDLAGGIKNGWILPLPNER